jgi:hypothetical protein
MFKKIGVLGFALALLFNVQTIAGILNERPNIDPQDVINKYIDAVGGLANISKIKNATMVMEAEFQGAKIVIKSIADQEKKRLVQETSFMGNVAQRTVLSNGKAKVTAMGQEQELSDEMVEMMNSQTFVFPEAHYKALGYSLNVVGDEEVNGESAHILEITAKNGMVTKEYYSKSSGLKLRTSSEATGDINYGSYEKVEGVLIPKSLSIKNPMLPVALEAKLVSIAFNSTLSDEDFK